MPFVDLSNLSHSEFILVIVLLCTIPTLIFGFVFYWACLRKPHLASSAAVTAAPADPEAASVATRQSSSASEGRESLVTSTGQPTHLVPFDIGRHTNYGSDSSRLPDELDEIYRWAAANGVDRTNMHIGTAGFADEQTGVVHMNHYAWVHPDGTSSRTTRANSSSQRTSATLEWHPVDRPRAHVPPPPHAPSAMGSGGGAAAAAAVASGAASSAASAAPARRRNPSADQDGFELQTLSGAGTQSQKQTQAQAQLEAQAQSQPQMQTQSQTQASLRLARMQVATARSKERLQQQVNVGIFLIAHLVALLLLAR